MILEHIGLSQINGSLVVLDEMCIRDRCKAAKNKIHKLYQKISGRQGTAQPLVHRRRYLLYKTQNPEKGYYTARTFAVYLLHFPTQ